MTAADAGAVTDIDNFQVARIAKAGRCTKSEGSRRPLFRKLGDKVAAGEPLYRVYAAFRPISPSRNKLLRAPVTASA